MVAFTSTASVMIIAFTQYGLEYLQQIVADERAAGNAPPQVKPTE
jgi:hypothetical protein